MKTAYVTPIIKKPNLEKSILSNYRPISNLSTLPKTLERVVARQLNAYLHDNHILTHIRVSIPSTKVLKLQ